MRLLLPFFLGSCSPFFVQFLASDVALGWWFFSAELANPKAPRLNKINRSIDFWTKSIFDWNLILRKIIGHALLQKGFRLIFDKISIVFSIISIDFWSHDVGVCLCFYLTCMFIDIYIYIQIHGYIWKYLFIYISLSFLGWVSSGACCFALQRIRLDSLLGAGLAQFAHRLDIAFAGYTQRLLDWKKSF